MLTEELRRYTVRSGDDLETIAWDHGVSPVAIWELEGNEELRELRLDPSLLLAGDELVLPDVATKTIPVETGAHHSFRLLGYTNLRIVFTDDDEPLADLSFVLKLVLKDGTEIPEISGTTDADGVLDQKIPIDAEEGEVILDPGGEAEQSVLFRLGELDPLDAGFRGVQAILNNLGYDCGGEDNVMGEKTRAAILAFQEDQFLEPLADDAVEIDDTTLEALEDAYFLWLDDPDETYEDDEEDDETKAALDAEEERLNEPDSEEDDAQEDWLNEPEDDEG